MHTRRHGDLSRFTQRVQNVYVLNVNIKIEVYEICEFKAIQFSVVNNSLQLYPDDFKIYEKCYLLQVSRRRSGAQSCKKCCDWIVVPRGTYGRKGFRPGMFHVEQLSLTPFP